MRDGPLLSGRELEAANRELDRWLTGTERPGQVRAFPGWMEPEVRLRIRELSRLTGRGLVLVRVDLGALSATEEPI